VTKHGKTVCMHLQRDVPTPPLTKAHTGPTHMGGLAGPQSRSGEFPHLSRDMSRLPRCLFTGKKTPGGAGKKTPGGAGKKTPGGAGTHTLPVKRHRGYVYLAHLERDGVRSNRIHKPAARFRKQTKATEFRTTHDVGLHMHSQTLLRAYIRQQWAWPAASSNERARHRAQTS